jgi:isopentenyl phosphate kinase
MRQKVEMMSALAEANPEVTISIFSGSQPGTLQKALAGFEPGTTIRAREE